jgi:hypothetical protein
MSSTRSDLYNFLKAIVKGGNFTDYMATDYTFEGLEDVKEFRFFNSNLINTDNNVMALPCVAFEIQSNPNSITELKTSSLNAVSNIKDNVRFVLHIFTSKLDDDAEQPYIDAMDLAEKIYHEIQGKKCAGVFFIRKMDEFFDNNSQVVIDYQLVFDVAIYTPGTTNSVTTTFEIQVTNE